MRYRSTLNRVLSISIGLSLVLLAMNIARTWLPAAKAITEPSHVAHTVTLKETALDGSGKTTSVHQYQIALTSSGIYAFKVEGPMDRQSNKLVRNIYMPSGLEIRVNDLAQRKSTRQAPAQILRKPANQCMSSAAGEKLDRIEDVAGHRAAKVTRPGVAEPRRTSWYSLDHGCALLRERGEWVDGAVSEKDLVNLVLGEPDESIIGVPAHYEESAPSGLFPGESSHSPIVHQALKRLDADYYKRRPQ